MRLLFVGDIHLSDKPPSTRTSSYADDILAKLREVALIANEVREDYPTRSVDAVVLAGDVFHSKIPHRTSHELTQRVIAVLKTIKRPVLCVPGNHDYKGANVAELDKAPLGTVAAAGALTLFGTPDNPSVTLPPPPMFTNLHGVREEEPIETFGRWELERGAHDVIVAHSPIFPSDQDPPYEHFKADQVAAHTGARWVLYGHIHDPHGVYEENGVIFVNPGSLSRGSLWESDPQRRPQVALVDTATEKVDLIKLDSARPWDEVFRVTEEYEKRDKDLAAAQFAAELAAASVEVFDVERVIAVLRERDDITTQVRNRAIDLIEQVG